MVLEWVASLGRVLSIESSGALLQRMAGLMHVVCMLLLYIFLKIRPNLATTRVFSMGSKFIPVWLKMKI